MARFFFIFHALSFEINFFFDRRFPLKITCEFQLRSPPNRKVSVEKIVVKTT